MQRIPGVTKYKNYQTRLFDLSISGLEVKERRVKRPKVPMDEEKIQHALNLYLTIFLTACFIWH